ncbi:bzip transcription factor [Fusarium austroafricanum]|uniref:Bzip transcription factor n=1 Tax=Fusarium austroafricanum TaxID=2364996 RepID=A0A8H4KME2_9HYPO|nr:bzip transcription factor [Fusarium austroafricanum]
MSASSPQSIESPGPGTPVATTSGTRHRAISAAPVPASPATSGPHRTPLSIKPSAKPPPPTSTQPQQRTALPSINKMAMSSVISPNPAPPEPPKVSMTSKEWVIPPRPKPGRKPATDTPPTKRKAQNRAAQRAFRERRAARVGELEEQLDQQREVQEKHESELKDKIHELELDVQSFRSRCMLLENMLERERQDRIRVETEAETLKRRLDEGNVFNSNFQSRSMSSQHPFDGLQSPTSQGPRHSLPDARPDRQSGHSFSISQIISPPDTLDMNSSHDVETSITCGNCTPNGPCACAEEVLKTAANGCGKCTLTSNCQCLDEAAEALERSQELKRPVSPSAGVSHEKRQRSNADAETDFTAMFSRKAQETFPAPSQLPSMDSMPFRDGCGFCKDGTYCVCADAALATPAMTPNDTLPPISQQVQTPPPEETDPPMLAMEMTADGAVKLPPRRTQTQPTERRGGCGPNGPGSCAQCQADPKSGLFCRLMAANLNRKDGSSGVCCGGKGAGGGCCKSQKPQQPEKINLPSLPSLGLSCAEAYQTLSSHRNFSKAQDDIGSWLPKLKATPRPGTRPAPPGAMMPIEVEAASIMSVLKDFDIRFGRGI